MHVADMISTARAQVSNLSVDEVAARLEQPDVVLVDVREANEHTTDGVIPGAIPAPRGMLEFHADAASPYHLAELTPDRQVIVYCKSGGRSALAAATLRSMGYERVAHLDGGIAAWNAAQRPTVRPTS